jgi:hypothetical protein
VDFSNALDLCDSLAWKERSHGGEAEPPVATAVRAWRDSGRAALDQRDRSRERRALVSRMARGDTFTVMLT